MTTRPTSARGGVLYGRGVSSWLDVYQTRTEPSGNVSPWTKRGVNDDRVGD